MAPVKKFNLIKGYIFVLLSAVIFGLMPLMTKFIYREGTNAESLVFLRSALAVPMLLILALITKSPVRIKPARLPAISFMALTGCCITPLLLFISYNHIPSGTATVFHFIYPAVVVIGEFILFKSKLKGTHVLSVVLCVVGIVLFYNGGEINLVGSALALLSGVAYAAYVLTLSGYKHKEISGFTLSFYIAIVCTAVMLAACLVMDKLMLPASLLGWILVFIFSLAINVAAVILFQKGTFLIGGGRASILSTVEPVTSVLAGAIAFSEKISVANVFGTALVVAASILIALSDRQDKDAPEEEKEQNANKKIR